MNIDALHRVELEAIQDLQLLRNPFIDSFMRFLNLLDTIPFYVFLITCIWYLYHQKSGFYLVILLVLSTVINADLKLAFSQPRPLALDPAVGMVKAWGYGFPSGAAQTMTALVGFLALTVQKRWCWIVGCIFVLLISFSRVYLGIHFPSDIVGGWVIGGALLGVFYWAMPIVEQSVEGQPKIPLLYLSVIATLILSFLCCNDKVLPLVFFAFGASVGYIFLPMSTQERSWKQRLARLAIVSCGMVGIQQITLVVLPSLASVQMVAAFIDMVAFCLIGWWLAVGGSLID